MKLHHRPIKTIITGKSGSGKTTYFQKLIENGFKSYWQTIFIYDWQGEIAERLNVNLDVETLFSLDDVAKAIDDEKGLILFDPSEQFEDSAENGFLAFTKLVYEVCKADDYFPAYPRLLAIDELQGLLGNKSIEPEIKAVMQTGRRCGLDLACVSQQLNEMHNTFRSQSTERVTFQHEDPYVLSVMQDWGFDPETVAHLPLGIYLYRNDKGDFLSGNVFTGATKKIPIDSPDQKTELIG